MPSLKDLRVRIDSVKSTRKITSAMKMVSAAKLRKAQSRAENGRPYAKRMETILNSLAASQRGLTGAPELLVGNGRDDRYLVVVVTSDRGLCGSFNSAVLRKTRALLNKLKKEKKEILLICVGKKSRDLLKREYEKEIVASFEQLGKTSASFATAKPIAETILRAFSEGKFDRCFMVYNQFKSALTQIVTVQNLIPFETLEEQEKKIPERAPKPEAAAGALYEYEPSEEEILQDLLPKNLTIQIYRALLESAAGEHGARMTAMDNATRNAGEMINKLTLRYNRTRQAQITKELIEIISGADAL